MDHSKSLLAVARERKGLTQSDLAEACGVTQATISNWETNECVPHASQWSVIAEAYEITLSRLLSHFGVKAS